ncbi:MAG: hypothetical protein DLM59_02700 [Pseudonocardiales bacterium]|nr:MAG: hypothetical protein DLM59_02700 [Pseudonocardiales bacterium]
MDATSGAAAVWWGIGLVVLFLGVIPYLLGLLRRVKRDIDGIGALADNILTHGGELTHNLDPIPALADTRDLVSTATGGFATYVDLVARILTGSRGTA